MKCGFCIRRIDREKTVNIAGKPFPVSAAIYLLSAEKQADSFEI